MSWFGDAVPKREFEDFKLNTQLCIASLESRIKQRDEEIRKLNIRLDNLIPSISVPKEELKYHEAELEALQQPKSCDGCKYYKKDNTTDCNGFTQDEECLRFIDEIHRIPCDDFCCNRYEAKEQ